MCAGVQKLSRPMERCHETSQCAPIATEVTARVTHHRYQGMRRVCANTCGLFEATETVAIVLSSEVVVAFQYGTAGLALLRCDNRSTDETHCSVRLSVHRVGIDL